MLIYGQQVAWWVAFSLFVVLGATDFVDGLMARREGSTVLGALIDPMADKIFVAAIMMSLVALGIFPGWIVTALLLREFLITALRSSVAIRHEMIKTSLLAKIKTVFQMGGSGTLFFTLVLPPIATFYVCLGLALPFLIVALVYGLKKKKIPFWAIPVFFAFSLVCILSLTLTIEQSVFVQMSIIIALTWFSALDYLLGTARLFYRTGMLSGDFARLYWGLIFGVFVTPLVADFPIIVLPLLTVASLEFGLGGMDNILSAKKNYFSSVPFLITGSAGLVFAAYINLGLWLNFEIRPLASSLTLAIISLGVFAYVFTKNTTVFFQKTFVK